MAKRTWKKLTQREIAKLFRNGVYQADFDRGVILGRSGEPLAVFHDADGYEFVRLYRSGSLTPAGRYREILRFITTMRTRKTTVGTTCSHCIDPITASCITERFIQMMKSSPFLTRRILSHGY